MIFQTLTLCLTAVVIQASSCFNGLQRLFTKMYIQHNHILKHDGQKYKQRMKCMLLK